MERKSTRKRLLWVMLISLGVLAAVAVGLRLLLSSGLVVDTVSSRLAQLYGGRLRVEDVDVRLFSGSSLGGLAFYEQGAGPDAEPWVTVDKIQTDASAWSALTGGVMPHEMTLRGATVRLRWDEKGNFVTAIPQAESGGGVSGELPTVRLEQGRLILHRADGAEIALSGVEGTLRGDAGALTLEGKVREPGWGTWDVAGGFTPGKQVALEMRTAGPVHVTPQKLNGLPFLPVDTLKQIRVDGETPVRLTLRYDLIGGQFHYRVEMAPAGADLYLADIDLRSQQTSGQVVVEDGVVHLADVAGDAYGGVLKAKGRVDYREWPVRLELPDIEALALRTDRLPKSWNFPPQIRGGRVTGQASVDAAFGKKGTQLRVDGSATILGAKVAGQPAESIRVDLHSGEQGLVWGAGAAGGAVTEVDADGPAVPLTEDIGESFAAVPTELVASAAAELNLLFQTVRRVELWVEHVPKEKAPAEAPKTSVLEINLKMKDVNLAEFATGLGLKLPFPVAGKLSFQAKAGVPVDTPEDYQAYRAAGSAAVAGFRLGPLEFADVRAKVDYSNGVLVLQSLTARLAGAAAGDTLSGTAKLPLYPLGDLTAALDVNGLAVGQLAPLLGPDTGLEGSLSGSVQVKAPGGKLQSVAAWDAAGTLKADAVTGYGLTMKSGAVQFRLKQGVAEVTGLDAEVAGAALNGSASLDLTEPYDFSGAARLTGAGLEALTRLPGAYRPPVALAGRADTSVKFHGTLSPRHVKLSGSVRAAGLQVDKFDLGAVSFDWSSTDLAALKLRDIDGKLYAGRVAGSAVIPLQAGAPAAVNLEFEKVGLGGLAKALQVPAPVTGEASGTLVVPAPGAAALGDMTGRLSLRSPSLRVRGIAVTEADVDAAYRGGKLDYKVNARALGGTTELEGTLDLHSVGGGDAGGGTLKLENLKLDELWEDVQGRAGGLPSGRLDVLLNFRLDPATLLPTGSGDVAVTDLKWGRRELSKSLKAALDVGPELWRLSRFRGELAGGELAGEVNWDVQQPARSNFELRLNNLDSEVALGPYGDGADGKLQARLRGTFGPAWRGSGDLAMARGKLAGLDVQRLQLPFVWALRPGGGVRAVVHRGGAEVARGRVQGRGELSLRNGLDVDANLEVSEVDMHTLLRELAGSERVGEGSMNGRITLSGRNVRSASDLQGSVVATFEEPEALSFPVLRQIEPFVRASSALTFDRGRLEATFARGLLRIRHLSMDSSAVQLFGQGTVTFGGRLDLEVIVRSSQFTGGLRRLEGFVMRIPLAGRIPAGALNEATQVLSRAAVTLDVSGTYRDPIIRTRVLRNLSEEAFRFFATR